MNDVPHNIQNPIDKYLLESPDCVLGECVRRSRPERSAGYVNAEWKDSKDRTLGVVAGAERRALNASDAEINTCEWRRQPEQNTEHTLSHTVQTDKCPPKLEQR